MAKRPSANKAIAPGDMLIDPDGHKWIIEHLKRDGPYRERMFGLRLAGMSVQYLFEVVEFERFDREAWVRISRADVELLAARAVGTATSADAERRRRKSR